MIDLTKIQNRELRELVGGSEKFALMEEKVQAEYLEKMSMISDANLGKVIEYFRVENEKERVEREKPKEQKVKEETLKWKAFDKDVHDTNVYLGKEMTKEEGAHDRRGMQDLDDLVG